jgi:O-antigen ligase
MEATRHPAWADRLDRFCAVAGGFLPMGIVIGNTGFESILAIVGLTWIVRLLLVRENPLPGLFKHPFVVPWLLMFASILISLAVNGPGGKGAAHDIVFLRHLLFLAAMLDVSRRLPLARYFLMGMAGGILLAIANIVSANAFGWDLMGKPLARYTSKLKEAARIAGLFAYLGPMFIAWAFSLAPVSGKIKCALLALGLAALVVLVDMRVRTAILAAGTGLCFWAIYLLYRRFAVKSLRVIIPVALLAGGLGAMYVLKQPLDSVYDRFGFYKIAWAVFQENPIFGVGISSFQDATREMAASGRVAPYIAPDGKQWLATEMMHAHNLPLMVVACTGIVGLVLFGWLSWRIVKVAFFQTEETFRYGLVLWLPIFLVIGLTGWSIYANWYHALFVYLTVFTGSVRRAVQT